MTDRVFHKDLWGPRESKYAWLAENDVSTTAWAELAPQSPNYLFTPQNTDLLDEYQRAWKLPDVMSLNGDPAPCIVTTHDQFAISWTAEEAKAKVERFLQTTSEEQARQIWRLCSQSQWSYSRAKQQLASGLWESQVESILYRPFDIRWTVYDSNVAVHRRDRVMRHMLAGQNLGLIFMRQVALDEEYSHFGVARTLADNRAFYSNKGIMYLAPLYLAATSEKQATTQVGMVGLSHWPEGKNGRRSNLNPEFVRDMEGRLGLAFIPDGQGDLVKTFGPEDVFHYIYAVLHSPAYRERYAEFLKIDFPRVPLTANVGLFRELVARGANLAALHLMESPALDQPITSYPVTGDNLVEPGHPRYLASGEPEPGTGKALAKGRVYISKDDPKTNKRGQYVEGVPPEVWGFQVGGYQVCDKWLKDRRGRVLTNEDITHYERIVVALKETIRLMAEIDATIDSYGGWQRAFES